MEGMFNWLIDTIMNFIRLFECPIKKYLHIYCPGCGGTRATDALLAGDIVSSLYYNPMVVGFLAFVTFVIALRTFDRATHRKHHAECAKVEKYTIYLVLGGWFAWFAVRNIMCFGFGIDWLGDFTV